MKNRYANPEMEMILLAAEDVIATSLGTIGEGLGDPTKTPWDLLLDI